MHGADNQPAEAHMVYQQFGPWLSVSRLPAGLIWTSDISKREKRERLPHSATVNHPARINKRVGKFDLSVLSSQMDENTIQHSVNNHLARSRRTDRQILEWTY